MQKSVSREIFLGKVMTVTIAKVHKDNDKWYCDIV